MRYYLAIHSNVTNYLGLFVVLGEFIKSAQSVCALFTGFSPSFLRMHSDTLLVIL